MIISTCMMFEKRDDVDLLACRSVLFVRFSDAHNGACTGFERYGLEIGFQNNRRLYHYSLINYRMLVLASISC